MADLKAIIESCKPKATPVACQMCRKPANQSLMLKLCQDCGAMTKDKTKREGEIFEVVYESEKSVPPSQEDNAAHEDSPQVELKNLDRPNNDSGFDGKGNSMRQSSASASIHKESKPLIMLPSAVNYPLENIANQTEAETLIQSWLNKSIHQLQILLTKHGIFIGPELVVCMIPVIECRLQQIIDYAIQDGRWRGDKVSEHKVRSIRLGASQLPSKCQELHRKIEEWNTKTPDRKIEFGGSSDPISNVKELSKKIVDAARPLPVLQPPKTLVPIKKGAKARESSSPSRGEVAPAKGVSQNSKATEDVLADHAAITSLFEDLSVADSNKTAHTKFKPSVVLSLPSESSTTKAGVQAVGNSIDHSFIPGFASSSPTVQESPTEKPESSAQLHATHETLSTSPNALAVISASEPKNDNETLDDPFPFPLPGLGEDERQDLKTELDLEWEFRDGGFPDWKKEDPLRMEKIRRQKQLEETSLLYLRKRARITAKIEELDEMLWEGR